jgi:hypothetical protein
MEDTESLIDPLSRSWKPKVKTTKYLYKLIEKEEAIGIQPEGVAHPTHAFSGIVHYLPKIYKEEHMSKEKQILNTINEVRVSKEFGSYNPRRHSKPWIAKIKRWVVGKSPDLEFGKYIGDEGGGEVEIDAEVGSIVRVGQKDYRGESESDWYVVQSDGSLEKVTATQARKAWDEFQKQKVEPKPDAKVVKEPDISHKLHVDDTSPETKKNISGRSYQTRLFKKLPGELPFEFFNKEGHMSQAKNILKVLEEIDLWEEEEDESSPKFFRIVDLDERGSYRAHVEDEDGKVVFEYSNENEEEQEILDDEGRPTGEYKTVTTEGDLWLVTDGFMKHVDDLGGLEKYLKEMKVIPKDASLMDGYRR